MDRPFPLGASTLKYASVSVNDFGNVKEIFKKNIVCERNRSRDLMLISCLLRLNIYISFQYFIYSSLFLFISLYPF